MIEPTEYDHEAIMDNARLGSSPSQDYLQVVDMLDNVVRECMYVSRSYAGIKSPTSKHFYASVLFTALITRGVSLAQLMPFTPWVEKRIEHWDYASAAGITRTMLELRVAFYYLCVDSCTDEEWNCRWNLFNISTIAYHVFASFQLCRTLNRSRLLKRMQPSYGKDLRQIRTSCLCKRASNASFLTGKRPT